MVGIIIHLIFVKYLQLACKILSVATGHFKVNELPTSGLEAL